MMKTTDIYLKIKKFLKEETQQNSVSVNTKLADTTEELLLLSI